MKDSVNPVVRTLRKARDLIRRRGWTQDAYARDPEGNEVYPLQAEASCFCARGAVYKATGDFDTTMVSSACFWFLGDVIPGGMISGWNDQRGRTKGEVVAAFDRAIRKAQKVAA